MLIVLQAVAPPRPQVSEESVAAAREVAAQAREAVRRACAGGVVIALPALPGPPPRRDAPQDTLHAFEDRVLQLTALAALSGAPQVRARAPLHTVQTTAPVDLWGRVAGSPC